MDMNELMYLLGRHEKYESLLDETWTVMPIGQLLTDFNAYIMLGLIEFQWCISHVRKVKFAH